MGTIRSALWAIRVAKDNRFFARNGHVWFGHSANDPVAGIDAAHVIITNCTNAEAMVAILNETCRDEFESVLRRARQQLAEAKQVIAAIEE